MQSIVAPQGKAQDSRRETEFMLPVHNNFLESALGQFDDAVSIRDRPAEVVSSRVNNCDRNICDPPFFQNIETDHL